jgi:C4-dicarboxylate transporter DctM subunit
VRNGEPRATSGRCVIGSIYGGVATPTEAGAIGALLAIVIALAQGRLTVRVLLDSIGDSTRTTAVILFVASGAILFTRFLALAGVPRVLATHVAELAPDPLHLVLALSLVYVVLGMFLDPLGLMLITLPVFSPMFKALNVDLIWIGVLVVKLLEIGLLTPPVGLNVYVVKGVAGDAVSLGAIFKGITWFLACEIVIMALLISFPAISLYLPSLMRQ